MPFCENCGNEVSPMASNCPKCGHSIGSAATPSVSGARRTDGTAIASLVLGIAGFVVCPLVCSVLAIVFGNQAQRKIATDPMLEGEGMAKAGVILGWIGIGFAVLIFIIFIAGASGATV